MLVNIRSELLLQLCKNRGVQWLAVLLQCCHVRSLFDLPPTSSIVLLKLQPHLPLRLCPRAHCQAGLHIRLLSLCDTWHYIPHSQTWYLHEKTHCSHKWSRSCSLATSTPTASGPGTSRCSSHWRPSSSFDSLAPAGMGLLVHSSVELSSSRRGKNATTTGARLADLPTQLCSLCRCAIAWYMVWAWIWPRSQA